MPAIQKRHLAILLDPDLVTRMRRQHIQRGDVKPELASLCEFAQTGAQGEEIVPRDAGGEVCEGFADVVDARGADAEDVAVFGCGGRGGFARGFRGGVGCGDGVG